LAGSFAFTSSYDRVTYFFQSFFESTEKSSTCTHFTLARYGAGAKPLRPIISSKSSSGTLNVGIKGGSMPVTQNILLPTLNTRSWPHLMSSVAPGSDIHISRRSSRVIKSRQSSVVSRQSSVVRKQTQISLIVFVNLINEPGRIVSNSTLIKGHPNFFKYSDRSRVFFHSPAYNGCHTKLCES
jgi:hypothetical protein